MKIHGVTYRALLPEKLDALLTAGRCMSATHVAASAGKSMGNCVATGHAADLAAAMCAKQDCLSCELNVSELQAALRADGFACPLADVVELAKSSGRHGESLEVLATSTTDISNRPRHMPQSRSPSLTGKQRKKVSGSWQRPAGTIVVLLRKSKGVLRTNKTIDGCDNSIRYCKSLRPRCSLELERRTGKRALTGIDLRSVPLREEMEME